MAKSKFDFDWLLWLIAPISIIVPVILAVMSLTLPNIIKFDENSIKLFLFIIVLSSIIGAMVALFTASKTQKIVEQAKIFQEHNNSLNRSILILKEILQSKFSDSLITYDDLKQIEMNVEKEKEIWVLTSELILEKDDLSDIIRQNYINKKITYKYLIPDSPKSLENKMRNLAQEWQKDCNLSVKEAHQKIQCYLVPKCFTYMTVVIYDPIDNPVVIVKFPTSEFYRKEKFPFIYCIRTSKYEQASANIFIESLQEMMENKNLSKKLIFEFSDITEEMRGEKQ